MTRTQRRACLTLGAMAKFLSKTNQTDAEKLMAKIEQWIIKQEEGN